MWIARELYFKVVYVSHTGNVKCSTYLAVGSDGVVSMAGDWELLSSFLFSARFFLLLLFFFFRWHQEASSEGDAQT